MPTSAMKDRSPVGSSSASSTSWQPAARPSTVAVPSAWSWMTCESSWPRSMASCSSLCTMLSRRSSSRSSSAGTQHSAPSARRTATSSASRAPTTSAARKRPALSTTTMAPAGSETPPKSPMGAKWSLRKSPRCTKMSRGTRACTKAFGVFTSTTRKPSSLQLASCALARCSLSISFASPASNSPCCSALASSSLIMSRTCSRAARNTRGKTCWTATTSSESLAHSLTLPSSVMAPMPRSTCSAWRLRVPSGSAA
mmetsp:Transcript_90578/g.293213  ORF Transcript_90578/g.293213 Transcript_90578/m.293213 type:complete len:255 (-) Transcript_90578:118-882(-)